MAICKQCEDLAEKKNRSKPHSMLSKLDETRIFVGSGSRGYEEQDYQCLRCEAKFTYSTDKNDLPWTLWRG